MVDRSNMQNNASVKRKLKKGAKNKDIQQYYADNMIEEIKAESPTMNMIEERSRNTLIDDSDEEENIEEIVNLEDEGSRTRLKKENMDKISDILVNMIFKNVINDSSHHST